MYAIEAGFDLFEFEIAATLKPRFHDCGKDEHRSPNNSVSINRVVDVYFNLSD